MTLVKNALLFLTLFFTLSFLHAQDALQTGWQHFAKNDFTAARASFQTLIGGPQTDQAHLALHLVATAEGNKQEEAYAHYVKFYETSSNPDPYLLGLWSSNSGRRSEVEVEFLERLTEQGNATLRAFAHQALGNHYFSSNDHKKSERHFDQIGSIENWAVLGEFENISESGFNKDFGALTHSGKGANFRNKRGVPVDWFDIKAPRWDKWVGMEYFFYADNSIIYAQNFCTSPREQEVQFRLGVSGSVKVWVNDQLLFSEAKERNNNIDAYIFPVKLSAGANRILIQLGESESDNCNFMLRITDNQGRQMEDLTFSTQVQAYDKNYSHQSEPLPDATEQFFRTKLADDPTALQNYLVLGQYFILNDEIFKAKSIISEARELYPECSYLVLQELLTYAKDGNRTATATLVEELKQIDPEGGLALSYLLDEAKQRDDLEEQEALISKIRKREGLSPKVYRELIELTGDKEGREKMFDLIDEAYKAHPDDYTLVYYKFYIEKEARNNLRGAVRVMRKYLEDHYNEEAIGELAAAYFAQNLVAQGLSTYEQLIENNPIATGYYSRLAGIYFNIGNYRKSKEFVEECIRIAPYIDSYHQTLAKTYAELGRADDANDAYRKAIFYNPYNYDARRELRILQEDGDIFDSFAEVDVYEVYENAPTGDAFPDDNSILLVDDISKVIYPEGGSEEKHVVLAKVFNTEGVDAWKEYRIPVYSNQDGSIDKAEVLKQDGGRIAAETDGGYIVFSNLEPGDAIHITYRLQNYFSGKLADHFWGNHYFQLFLPVAHTRLSLLVPTSRDFDFKVENGTLAPSVEDRGEHRLYTWEAKDVPATEYENLMPNLSDVGMVLHYSSFPDWNYIADWYADLAQAKSKVDFEVENLANQLFAEQAGLSEREKVEKIYDYIVNNIRYRSVSFLQSGLIPQKASATISAKQGDCKDVSTLFVALCKTQNIDADLVLINTRNNGHKEMMLPSIDFNHCIVRLPLEDKEYYLELTAENLPFAVKSNSTYQAFALRIPQNGEDKVTADLLTPTAQVPATAVRSTEVSFLDDKMIVEKENTKTGLAASSMRNSYENVGAEMHRKKMQEAINNEAPGVSLLDVKFHSGLDNNNAEIKYAYRYEIPAVFSDIGGLRIFGIPFADDLKNPDFLAQETREHPVALWQYFNWEYEEETLKIELPDGYTLAEVPEPINIDTKNIVYELTFELNEEQLVVKRIFNIKNDIVTQQDYAELKSAIEQIVKADVQKLAFKQI